MQILNKLCDSIEDYDIDKASVTNKTDFIYFMIKNGLSNMFDITRDIYSDTIQEIYQQFGLIKEELKNNQLKLHFSEGKGYYFVLNENDVNTIKSDLAICKKVGKKYHCSTNSIVSLTERIFEIRKELNRMSFQLLKDIIIYVQSFVSYLYVASSNIAFIDFIVSLTTFCKENQIKDNKIIRPLINYNNIINIRNSKHPLLSFLNNNLNVISNDLFLTSNFNILTIKGPNASGKTTFMKQIGLLIILAQIGCFVPAEYFDFTPRKFIFSIFPTEGIKSSLISNINEIDNYCLENKTSLILIDEPFDNSNNTLNFSISITLLNNIASKMKNSYILLSSHNQHITYLNQFIFNCISGTMQAILNTHSLKFQYKLLIDNHLYLYSNNSNNEVNEQDKYGILLAKMIDFDDDIVSIASSLSNDYKETNNYSSILLKNTLDLQLPQIAFKTFLYDVTNKVNELDYLSKHLHEETIKDYETKLIKKIKNIII